MTSNMSSTNKVFFDVMINGGLTVMKDKEQSKSDKKKWQSPRLIEYGSVQSLTQSGATVSANDGGTHRARKP
jgi:hypothetical protein